MRGEGGTCKAVAAPLRGAAGASVSLLVPLANTKYSRFRRTAWHATRPRLYAEPSGFHTPLPLSCHRRNKLLGVTPGIRILRGARSFFVQIKKHMPATWGRKCGPLHSNIGSSPDATMQARLTRTLQNQIAKLSPRAAAKVTLWRDACTQPQTLGACWWVEILWSVPLSLFACNVIWVGYGILQALSTKCPVRRRGCPYISFCKVTSFDSVQAALNLAYMRSCQGLAVSKRSRCSSMLYVDHTYVIQTVLHLLLF